MNTEQLDHLESFDKKQLEIIATGIIKKSNLAEFEADANKFIDSIKTKLETDEDFAEAKVNVATCKAVEVRISTSWDDLINQIPTFANAKKVIFDLQKRIATSRLFIDKLVVSEDTRKKRDITQGAKDRLNGLLINSAVKHGFTADAKAIDLAIKNKRLYSKMQEAVDEVVEVEELRLANLEADYSKNIAAIEKAETDWPITFHDKRTLALGNPEAVEATVQARIADHRLKVAEKAQKDKDDLAAKETPAVQEEIKKPATSFSFGFSSGSSRPASQQPAPPQDSAWQPEELPSPFTDLPLPPPILKTYKITVTASASKDWADRLVDIIGGLGGVETVGCEELK